MYIFKNFGVRSAHSDEIVPAVFGRPDDHFSFLQRIEGRLDDIGPQAGNVTAHQYSPAVVLQGIRDGVVHAQAQIGASLEHFFKIGATPVVMFIHKIAVKNQPRCGRAQGGVSGVCQHTEVQFQRAFGADGSGQPGFDFAGHGVFDKQEERAM